MSDTGIDTRFYPATGTVDWEPLHKIVAVEDCGQWMFMQVEDGIRFYKHSATREYLLLDTEGNAYDFHRQRIPVLTAYQQATHDLEWAHD